jgi:GT2 family glycosyltransferase/glycosyltransferase involved in cell wall biosynthesis
MVSWPAAVADAKSEMTRQQEHIGPPAGTVENREMELAELDNLRNRIRFMTGELAARQIEITHLEAQVSERESNLARFHDSDIDLERLRLEWTSQKQELVHIKAEADQVRSVLNSLIGSTSWKITGPLRWAKLGTRSIKRFVSQFTRFVRHRLRMRQRSVPVSRALPLAQENAAAVISSSGLFDSEYYRSQLAVPVPAVVDPILHYIDSGAKSGLDPHPLFDTSYYCDLNPDVAAADINPLVHYLLHGAAENRDPHDFFDTSFYKEANPDVVEAGINPLVHYVLYGFAERRDPHALFDTTFYLEQRPHTRTLGVNPLVHFVIEGAAADFDPMSDPPKLPETGICIVTPDIVGPVKNGGIGTACHHFARILAEEGHTVTVLFSGDLTNGRKAHWRNAYGKMGIHLLTLSDTPPFSNFVYGSSWFLERSWRIFKYLRSAHYSVVHFQDWQGNGFWSLKAKKVGLAFSKTTLTVMAHSCTDWINEGMQQFSAEAMDTAKLVWVETYCMENCDVLLSPSHYMLQWLTEKQVCPPKQTNILPYAWAECAIEVFNERGSVDIDHLIFFGRLETRKGLHIFGDAIRRLKLHHLRIPHSISFLGKHASVLGKSSQEYIEELQHDFPSIRIRTINNFDHVQAMEYIRETHGLVVIASILDNFPFTVIECIQNSISFIAAATGGILEMVDPAITFRPDSGSLAELLKGRHAMDFRGHLHRYVAADAAEAWLDLHLDFLGNATEEGNILSKRSSIYHPKVSICVPYFEHAQYLESLVSAFARQQYPNFQVIFVNDGSAAEASEVFNLTARRTRDARFKFVNSENGGPGAARNVAVRHASGELLLFFDADNLPKGRDFIGILVRALECSGADCVTCAYDIVSADRIQVSEEDVLSTYRPFGSCIEAGFIENILGDATMIIKRPVFEKVGGFPHQRASWEDHEFLLNLCLKGFALEVIPYAIFYYRQSPTGRNQLASDFHNYRSLLGRLEIAPPEKLTRIINAVAGPLLMNGRGDRAARLVAR